MPQNENFIYEHPIPKGYFVNSDAEKTAEKACHNPNIKMATVVSKSFESDSPNHYEGTWNVDGGFYEVSIVPNK